MATQHPSNSASPEFIESPRAGSWGALLLRVSSGREVWALSDQALVSGANFLTFALLARALGVSEFGVFALSWAMVLLANSVQMALIVSPMMSVGPKQDA